MLWLTRLGFLDTALTGGAVEVLILAAHSANSTFPAMEVTRNLSHIVLIGGVVDVADLAEVVSELQATLGALVSGLQYIKCTHLPSGLGRIHYKGPPGLYTYRTDEQS